MKRTTKTILAVLLALVLAFSLVLAGCSSSEQAAGSSVYVTQIEKTGTDGLNDVYTVTYSDGSTSTFTVTNGSDGEDLTITDVYEEYKQTTGSDLTFEEFLKQYLTVSDESAALAIQKNLLSVMKIYSEFVVTETTSSMYPPFYTQSTDTAIYTGSAVLYDMDTGADGYTYIVTNYHVVYLADADTEKNGGTNIARKIRGYLYGSEGSPSTVDEDNNNVADTDSDGYTKYDYGSYAIELEYIGGSVSSDIAVLRAKTSDILAINESAAEITLADGYHVGETAIAIGNPEGRGISVTQGVISTESDYISLDIDGTARSYRSIRIDTPLYQGNSGGGLFNADGELIGITNAGNSTEQNINYAIPLEIVTGTADNIIRSYEDGNDATNGAYKITLGVTVSTQNSKYVYDAESGYGAIEEEVVVQSVESGSIAETLGLAEGDVIKSIIVNGTEHAITRSFNISDLILTLRTNDILQVKYERSGAEETGASYTLQSSDFTQLD